MVSIDKITFAGRMEIETVHHHACIIFHDSDKKLDHSGLVIGRQEACLMYNLLIFLLIIRQQVVVPVERSRWATMRANPYVSERLASLTITFAPPCWIVSIIWTLYMGTSLSNEYYLRSRNIHHFDLFRFIVFGYNISYMSMWIVKSINLEK